MTSLKKSVQGQVAQMSRRFPNMQLSVEAQRLIWTGSIRPLQKEYLISLTWGADNFERPYVMLLDPALTPRAGTEFEDIPHLLFNRDNPAQSGMCLFDPDQKQWDPRYDYIAKTTIPWASKWLANYEYWHLTGEWIGDGVLPATVRELDQLQAIDVGDAA